MISDNVRNFALNETVEFVNGLGVNWRLNMMLTPWHGGFFERMVRSTKTLLRKTLQTATAKGEHPTVQIGDVVVMEEGNMLRSS